jgi:MATE family multidrug resistance protein
MKMKSSIGPLIRLAVPVALSNLGLMMMGLVDLMAVGRLGAEAVSAVGLGNSIVMWGLVIGIGMMAGLDYLASSSLGASNPAAARLAFRVSWRGTFFLGLPAALLTAASGWGLESVGIPPNVAEATRWFLVPFALSMIPSWWFEVARRMLQAHRATRAIVFSLIVANLANVAGNIIWVAGAFGFTSYGVAASGWVSFASRMLMAAVVLLELRRRDPQIWKDSFRPQEPKTRATRKDLFRLGVPGGLQMGLEAGVFSLSSVLATRLGAIEGAAHQIVLNLASVTFMVPLGIGQAGAVLVGHEIGAKRRAAAFRNGWQALGLSTAFMSLTCLVFLSIPGVLLTLYTQDGEIIALGAQVLWIAGAFQLFDGLQVTLTGVLRGIGNTRDSAISNGVGHWLIGLPLALWLGKSRGVPGIWMGLAIGLAVVALLLLWRWRTEQSSS